ncbi:hypothetical protein ACJQWK_00253 [Exserohilum turcicum]|uniref:Uncharacterized protein n=1 Tax=Exserohilum turcicum (strain 28A) TaxID=671987 RepID=R0JQR3_EXST2|nr:uncharacterized protein SETTUDRAFT_164851 [Exserohilum turcica Et28A]EOA83498.1 hypothetical protein SETTUDRAFT_164851 [Exserohilum turcica Et28A]
MVSRTHPTQTRSQQGSHAVLAQDTSSTATNCSCVYSATGKLAHTCTALSYNSQTIVAPKQDAATQSADLMSVGAQFDDAK